MLKINLLPKSIYDKLKMRNAAILFGCLALLILLAGLAYSHYVLAPSIRDMTAKADEAERIQQQVQLVRAQAKGVRDSIAPIQAKLDFINAVLKYNVEYPKLYEEVARWTYDRVVVNAMDCDGTTLTMGVRARSLNDIGRYLLNIYRATHLFAPNSIGISGVPGYGGGTASGTGTGGPIGLQAGGAAGTALAGIEAIGQSLERRPAEASWIDFTVTCKLKNPIVAPQFVAPGAAGAEGAGPGGMPGGAAGPETPAAPGPQVPGPPE